jgi:hypothetical protein
MPTGAVAFSVPVEAAVVFKGVDHFAVVVKAFAKNPPFAMRQAAVGQKVVPQYPNLPLLVTQVSGFSGSYFAAGDTVVNPVMLVLETIFQGTSRSRSCPGQTNDDHQGGGENVSFLHGILLCWGLSVMTHRRNDRSTSTK